jgi:hypothetical protein
MLTIKNHTCIRNFGIKNGFILRGPFSSKQKCPLKGKIRPKIWISLTLSECVFNFVDVNSPYKSFTKKI